MGLFDDPLGFIFGDDGDQGVLDRRANREPEGQRWWERWEQTFGGGGPMDPLNVYPQARSALDMIMGQYFPGWGGASLGGIAPMGPAPADGGNFAPAGRTGYAAPGLLELERGQDNIFGMVRAGKGNLDNAGAAMPGARTMEYRLKEPGEPGYDPVRDRLPADLTKSGWPPMQGGSVEGGQAEITQPIGLQAQPASGGPGLLEPFSIKIGGQKVPVLTKYDRARMDLPFRYAAAMSGLMDPWLQGGLELERGRYGQPYQNQGGRGLLGDVLVGGAGGLGAGIGKSLFS
ncbi:hypothetical protein AAU61_14480 [Desulfocarbo indianensis]|nr:hypothetical protein AAU61_14480 [Desulfocarbo indianensis]